MVYRLKIRSFYSDIIKYNSILMYDSSGVIPLYFIDFHKRFLTELISSFNSNSLHTNLERTLREI